MKRLLGVTNIGGRIERDWLHTDNLANDVITTETVQDVEPIIKRNRDKYNSASDSFGKGELHEIAEIPATVIEQKWRESGMPFREVIGGKSDRAVKFWNEILNAPEFRYFRTRPGRVDAKCR